MPATTSNASCFSRTETASPVIYMITSFNGSSLRLSVQSVASGLGGGEWAGRLARVVSDLDETINQIRTSIFQLRGPLVPQTTTLRSALLDVVAEATPLLGFEPRVRFAGPIDISVPDVIVDDVVAVLREGLTNVAR